MIGCCANCGEAVNPGAKFCVNCGEPVDAGRKREEEATLLEGGAFGKSEAPERRQLTVLFCDLARSTAISEQLDPEDYGDLIARYRAAVSDIVSKYGGHVANFAGDGIVALFGYRVVQEGSAYAAALAALEMADAAPAIAAGGVDQGVSTAVRVGLHTGPVVVGESGEGAHSEKMALFGDTPNVAARIQNHASPGQVVVSDITKRLIGPHLLFESLGRPALAGVSEPVELFLVRRSTAAFDSERHTLSRPSTPIIGRKAEIALVETRWEAAGEGDGQVLVITGEGGIGKSRIVFSLSGKLTEENAGAVQLTLFGSPLHKNSAFYSVKAALAALLRLGEAESAEVQRQKLNAFLTRFGVDQIPTVGPLARLLGFDEALGEMTAASPEREKAEIISALLKLTAAMTSEQPLLMVLDDVHWIDPSTLEFVSRWIEMLPERRCLLLITARPEFVSPWKNLAHVTSLELNRLGRRETVAMIENIAGRRPPDTLLDQIVARTDGVPLFIEELTKMIVESGILTEGQAFRGNLALAIPESLQDSLMARLDRLAAVKEVAQVAAVIGRSFTGEVLSRVQDRPEAEVAEALSKLIDADLIVPTGGVGETPSFRFRHALVQDAAYQSMLRSARSRWHGRIARILEEDFSETTEREPELLGHHYLLAGNHAAAERYWLAAARVAMARSANVEAIEHLERALECLRHTPDCEERDRREMDLQILIAVPLAFVNGYAHQSVRAAYSRARLLCRRYGEVERLFKVVYGQLRSALLGGEYATAQEHSELVVSLSEELDDPLMAAATGRSLGAVLTYLGRPEEAVIELRKGLAYELSLEDRIRGLDFDVVDLKVALHGYLAFSEWLRGCATEAQAAATRALEASRETDHPFSVSFALAFSGWVYQFSGDVDAVRASSSRLIELSEQNTFQFWLGWGRIMNGWARREELGERALQEISTGLQEWRGTGSRLGLSYFLYLHADAALALGRESEAEAILADAAAFVRQSGEGFWKPEIIRLGAEIALARGDHAGCVARLRKAVDTAREMGLHGSELRAAVVLAQRAAEGPDQLAAAQALTAALNSVAADNPAAVEAREVLHAMPLRRLG